MANYNTTTKIIRGEQGAIETAIQNYVNALDSAKTIRAISIARYGADNLICLIVHDT